MFVPAKAGERWRGRPVCRVKICEQIESWRIGEASLAKFDAGPSDEFRDVVCKGVDER